MAKAEAKKEKRTILVEGRMINGSLFEKDRFDEKSTPKYKIEIAIPKSDKKQIDSICEELLGHADDTWGAGCGELNIDGGKIISGLLDGELLKKKREAKDKEGKAYEGMWVLRADTQFNREGQDAPGGIQVWDEDVKPIGPANQGAIWSGCYVSVALTISDYEDDRSGNHGLKFYLDAVQKIGGDPEKDKLASSKDTSTLFKPVGRTAGAATSGEGGRRRRAG